MTAKENREFAGQIYQYINRTWSWGGVLYTGIKLPQRFNIRFNLV